jgi:hypothetical protein
MDTIENHIEKDRKILDDPQVSSQARRHIQDELRQLENYKKNHPEDHHDPTPLELYCDAHPEALECRFYND